MPCLLLWHSAEAVLLSTMEHLGVSGDWIPRVASGFGGGIGRTGLVCGAISGAVIAAGWRFGRDSADQDKEKSYEISKEISRSFATKFGSTQCKELIGLDLTDPAERQRGLESGVFTETCAGLVEFCAVEISGILSH